jgi:hypothetical protein
MELLPASSAVEDMVYDGDLIAAAPLRQQVRTKLRACLRAPRKSARGLP